jgi:hypothetical protein
MRGSIASARARATRWRWPPDNWLGAVTQLFQLYQAQQFPHLVVNILAGGAFIDDRVIDNPPDSLVAGDVVEPSPEPAAPASAGDE